jgi:UDP-2-acetamido-2,6-beta-L-arabino-hexul-4-ose reductase
MRESIMVEKPIKILVTGAKGFVGKNLVAELRNRNYSTICEFDLDSDPNMLDQYTQDCNFVFHLAGINRPKDQSEFMTGNFGFTSELLQSLKKHDNKSPILITSSIQAALDSPYGLSKKAGEELIFEYSRETGVKVFVYRLPNIFGKWCMPNYNSAVATFCNNIANGFPISISDPEVLMNLVYIDDLLNELIRQVDCHDPQNSLEKYCSVSPVHKIKLGDIAALIYSFKESRSNLSVPDLNDSFTKKLYSTYLSYLPIGQFSYPLKMNVDNRGSFTEFIKTHGQGQVSVNISRPGITKGNHWHHTKCEKFLIVSGKGVIRFRKVGTNEILEYFVSGENLDVVDIPVGYTHNIENLGSDNMVTIMWANEAFDPERPDTFFEQV